MARNVGMESIANRKSAWSVDIDKIAIQPGFNRRQNREKFEVLKAQILEVGQVITPITGFFRDGSFWVNHGHGRVEAVKQLVAEGNNSEILKKIPAIVEPAPKNKSDEARLLARQIIDNSGENFKPIESAQVCQTMIIDYGYTREEVAKMIGESPSSVSNWLKLLELPDSIQDSISNGEVSASLITSEVRTNGQEATVERVEKAKALLDSGDGKRKKITKKDLDKVDGIKRLPKKELLRLANEISGSIKSLDDGNCVIDEKSIRKLIEQVNLL